MNDTNYTYDANGNQLTGSGRTIQWTSFNKAKLITGNNASTKLSYDANHNRAIQTIRNDGVKIEDGEDRYWVKRGKWGGSFETQKRYIYVDNIETTYYSVNGYEMVEEFKNNKTYKKFRINLTANGKQIGIYVKSLEGTNQEKAIDRLRYFHKDALGNIDLITDIDGKVVARQHYQAFGKRDQNLSDDVVIDEVKRGFTSHEHIDELGLINMNARLYDPETARFLSADSFIQDPNLTLSHNRYIYVMNNPLKYTDPSGHFWNFIVGAIISYAASQSDNPFIRTLGMIAGGAMMGGAFGGETLFASTLHTKMAAGFVMGGINGGDAQGAILGAMSAGLTYGIGHGGTDALGAADGSRYFDSFVGTAIAHGTAQGIIAEASGGSFQSGFAAGFSGHLAGGLTEGLTAQALGSEAAAIISQTTIVATLGGLASKATGGSFEDGAYRAATVHLFNKLGDIFTAKLRLGLHAGIKVNTGKKFKGNIAADAASADLEWVYNVEDGWRHERVGHQGIILSGKVEGVIGGELSVDRTHPRGQPNWSDWNATVDGNYRNIPLDGVYGAQAGALISPGFEIDFNEIINWWNN
ncbi:Rhs family protein [hydrothermal vent metagenome]|uniref:Rhs family protein n=1 Tax=hydrothermal vent metagenome TaxID=652676 RepID=A0A1W1DY42_9ZZZZ